MRTARTAAALAGAVAWIALMAGPVHGHALLRSSSPASNAVLDDPPSEVVLTFSEAPDPSLSQVRVVGPDGADAAAGPLRSDAASPERVRVPLRPLEEGVYAVSWRVFSSVDGHVTAGVFAFGVGTAVEGAAVPQVAEPDEPAPDPIEVGGRFLLYLGLSLLAGTAWTSAIVFGGPRAAGRWTLSLATAVSVAGAAAIGIAQLRASGGAPAVFLATPIGRAVLLRVVGSALAGAAAVSASRGRLGRAWLAVSGGLAAATMLVHVASGHAGAGPIVPLTVGSQWVHFLAAGIWVGGLAVLLGGLREGVSDGAGAVRRYSATAAAMLVAVAVTGVHRSVVEVGSWEALWRTRYGLLVVAKVVGLLGLAALGALNRFRHVRVAARGDLSGLRRVGRAEVVLGVAIAGVVGLLTTLTPPRGDVPAPPVEPVAASGSDFGTTVRVRLAADPGSPGLNRFEVRVVGFDDGGPVEARRVGLRFEPPPDADAAPSTLDLEEREPGTWTAHGPNLTVDGTWRVTVVVERGARGVEVPLELTTRCRSTPIRAPGQPTLHDVEIGGGRTVQGYADPGRPGSNEIHFTFFDAEGNEMSVGGFVQIGATRRGGERVRTDVRQFSPGHFVSVADLSRGTWRFDVNASTIHGERLNACFEEVL
ncbi:MAG TPA: copper resistance protein CopC [Actinomycetota bacterium]|nr:copper resistance protein CopC [Actinomycetota bacterium]